MNTCLPRATQIGSRQVAETLRKLTAEVGGLKAFEPGVREAIGNTNWTVLMQRLDEAEAALSRIVQAPVADGVREALREAYDFLSGNYQNLSTGNWHDDDAGLVASKVLAVLDDMEMSSALASSDPTPATEAGGAAMPADAEWYHRKAALEGDHEIGVGKRLTSTINSTPEEIVEFERLALEALPKWAQDEIRSARDALRQSKPQALPDGWKPLTCKGDRMTCPMPPDETIVEVMLEDGTICPAWYGCNIMDAGDWDFMPVNSDDEPDDDSIADKVIAWRYLASAPSPSSEAVGCE
jgi:hypothetical protein